MDILIGANHQWANVQYVALIDGAKTLRASSLLELAQLLYALGADERTIRLASHEDGDRSMSVSEHAEFRAAWVMARASANA